jgi:hypothetical protein
MTDRYAVSSNPQRITYGPAPDQDGWVLTVVSDEGRVEIVLDEDAMYQLWTEVCGVPWPFPDHETERDRLVRQVIHFANGSDEETLREVIRVLRGESDR